MTDFSVWQKSGRNAFTGVHILPVRPISPRPSPTSSPPPPWTGLPAFCPGLTPLPLPGAQWHILSSAPAYTVCNKCFALIIAPSPLAPYFRPVPVPPGTRPYEIDVERRVCLFSTPHAKRRWKQALIARDIEPFIAYARARAELPPCARSYSRALSSSPDSSLPKEPEWYTPAPSAQPAVDDGDFFVCATCYADEIAGTPAAHYFTPSNLEPANTRTRRTCTISTTRRIHALTRSLASGEIDWPAYARDIHTRLHTTPACPGANVRVPARSRTWFRLRDGLVKRGEELAVLLCDACHLDCIFSARMLDVLGDVTETDFVRVSDAAVSAADGEWTCDAALPSVRFALAHAFYQPQLPPSPKWGAVDDVGFPVRPPDIFARQPHPIDPAFGIPVSRPPPPPPALQKLLQWQHQEQEKEQNPLARRLDALRAAPKTCAAFEGRAMPAGTTVWHMVPLAEGVGFASASAPAAVSVAGNTPESGLGAALDVDACAACFAAYVRPLGFEGRFVPLVVLADGARVCDFDVHDSDPGATSEAGGDASGDHGYVASDDHDWTYNTPLAALVGASAMRDIHIFEHLGALPPCPGANLHGTTGMCWFGAHGWACCPACWVDVVRGTSLDAQLTTRGDRSDDPAQHCMLSSPRTRALFASATSVADLATMLAPRAAVRAQVVPLVLVREIRARAGVLRAEAVKLEMRRLKSAVDGMAGGGGGEGGAGEMGGREDLSVIARKKVEEAEVLEREVGEVEREGEEDLWAKWREVE